jgi:hypothetical protein
MLTAETWNASRLDAMISSKIEENFSLDYKAAGAIGDSEKTKREITKDVSAMANSSGGTIIYGVAEYADDARRHLPEMIDPISRLQFSKEWLEHVISNIKPRIESLKITPVEIPTNPDHVVYVVEIPKSTTAHQASDFRYYRRYNFESVPMHDYEIRDIMNRMQFPTLSVSASIGFNRFGNEGTLHFEIQNTSDVLAKDFAVIVHAPIRWQGRLILFKDATLDKLADGSAFRLKFSNAISTPLFPKSSRYKNFEFGTGTMNPEPKISIKDIRYRIYADAMPFIEGSFEPDQIARKPGSI